MKKRSELGWTSCLRCHRRIKMRLDGKMARHPKYPPKDEDGQIKYKRDPVRCPNGLASGVPSRHKSTNQMRLFGIKPVKCVNRKQAELYKALYDLGLQVQKLPESTKTPKLRSALKVAGIVLRKNQ